MSFLEIRQVECVGQLGIVMLRDPQTSFQYLTDPRYAICSWTLSLPRQANVVEGSYGVDIRTRIELYVLRTERLQELYRRYTGARDKNGVTTNAGTLEYKVVRMLHRYSPSKP